MDFFDEYLIHCTSALLALMFTLHPVWIPLFFFADFVILAQLFKSPTPQI
jgi:hypothetical protein